MARVENLVAMSEAGAPGESAWADVRGWRAIAGDGTLLGQVADVLVERGDEGKPRFLQVALEPAVARAAAGKRVYAPFDAARVDPDARTVHLDGVTGERALELPTDPDDAPFVTGPFAPRADLDDADDVVNEPLASSTDVRERVVDEERITLSEEELLVGTRTVSAGEVRVEKRVETEQVRESVPVTRDDVSVERRPLAPGASLERWEDEEGLHIPLVEEEMVIEKRLVAREELLIRKRRVTEEQVVEETLRKERAEVIGPEDLPLSDR
ncbi:MAG TPA: PRC and DUF2382 domain-containing protein [Longimicrobium sp.]|nr:PRC and DUF2382 domain-containing protein [Longimicrobium sp.]